MVAMQRDLLVISADFLESALFFWQNGDFPIAWQMKSSLFLTELTGQFSHPKKGGKP